MQPNQYLQLAEACRMYGARIPVSQQVLLGIMAGLLRDNPDLSDVVASRSVTCQYCAQWTGKACRRARSALVWKPCQSFFPARGVLVLAVRPEDVEN